MYTRWEVCRVAPSWPPSKSGKSDKSALLKTKVHFIAGSRPRVMSCPAFSRYQVYLDYCRILHVLAPCRSNQGWFASLTHPGVHPPCSGRPDSSRGLLQPIGKQHGDLDHNHRLSVNCRYSHPFLSKTDRGPPSYDRLRHADAVRSTCTEVQGTEGNEGV